jgi:predicted nuclease of predicted toxin-antitoxin system
MKFIVDENLPWRAAAWLKTAGHEAWHVAELHLVGRPDTLIWNEAVARGACILTRDNDFVVIARSSSDVTVIRLAIGNCSTATLLARLETLWPEVERRLASGERLIELG